MLPVPQVTELDELPPEFGPDTFWPGLPVPALGLTAGSGLKLSLLHRFKELMAAELWGVQLPRMCYDRLYAYERIAQAHASANAELRAVALALFQAYHHLDARAAGAPADPRRRDD